MRQPFALVLCAPPKLLSVKQAITDQPACIDQRDEPRTQQILATFDDKVASLHFFAKCRVVALSLCRFVALSLCRFVAKNLSYFSKFPKLNVTKIHKRWHDFKPACLLAVVELPAPPLYFLLIKANQFYNFLPLLEITVLKKLLCLLAFGLASTFSLQASAQNVNNVGGAGGAPAGLNKDMDVKAMLIEVQTNRANLLDAQLKGEMQNVQAKNAKMVELNTQLVALRLAKGKTTDPQTIAKLDNQINDLSTQINTLGSTQQMDMLRLQSLSNKRNEAYDILTNFKKKLADEKPGIIGNTR